MKAAWALVLLAACERPAEDRALAEQDIGRAEVGNAAFEVEGGLAHIRAIEPGAVELWAQAPVLRIAVDASSADDWTITVGNVLPDAVLTAEAGGAPLPVTDLGGERPTRHAWRVALPPGAATITIAPPDAGDLSPWHFAAMADIQTALPEVDEVFAVIEEHPEVRFVVSMGDLTSRGKPWEYDLFEEQLATLDVPYYTTIGNHELFGDSDEFLDRYGRFDVHFDFRGVAFTIVDSGSATIDPIVHGWIDAWLAEDADRIHVFATHYPLLDPIGVRGGAFASQREAAGLLDRLAAGRVDLTLYGHIHTFDEFANAGIPARISGGGGAEPMRLDGIDRHFLIVAVDPAAATITDVAVARVDEPWTW